MTDAVRILIFDIVPVVPNFKAACGRFASSSIVFDAIVCALMLICIWWCSSRRGVLSLRHVVGTLSTAGRRSAGCTAICDVRCWYFATATIGLYVVFCPMLMQQMLIMTVEYHVVSAWLMMRVVGVEFVSLYAPVRKCTGTLFYAVWCTLISPCPFSDEPESQ